MSCSLISSIITFFQLLGISNSKSFPFLDKITKSNTMKKFNLFKVIHNLQLMSKLRLVQRTEKTKKPNIRSLRKNAYFGKGAKFYLANKTFYGLDALVQNE